MDISFSTAASVCVAVLALCCLGRWWYLSLNSLHLHWFPLLFLTEAVVYLQIAPAYSLLYDAIYGNPFVDTPTRFAGYYAFLQITAFVAFIYPVRLLTMQTGQLPRVTHSIAVDSARAQVIATLSILFACGFLLALAANPHIVFFRYGSAGNARMIVELDSISFYLFRGFNECLPLLVGTLFAMSKFGSRADTSTTRLTRLALLLVVASGGLWALINSRYQSIVLLLYVCGWSITLSKFRWTRAQALRALGIASVGCLPLIATTMAVRQYMSDESTITFNILAYADGLNRLNGIDLMARISPVVETEGLAWGRAWTPATWVVWRFVDPEGFAAVRLQMEGTAKVYLMQRYLGWDDADYYSCVLTDFYGNFGIIGIAMAAGIIGYALRRAMLTLYLRVSGTGLILSVFLLTHVAKMETEGATLLFGWLRVLPLLFILLMICPFRAVPVRVEAS